MTVLNFVRNGGKMITGVEELQEQMTVVVSENDALKSMLETYGAIIVTISDQIGVMGRKLDKIQDEVTYSKNTTDEIKHKKFYGQEAELLPSAIEKAKKMSGAAKRALIHSAARTHEGGRQRGYTDIYAKLLEVTGFSVYDVGQITLKKSDGIEGWKKDPSYINAIFKEGKTVETAVICMQILAGK